MGGEITVDSEAGVGSTFHLTIPVSLPAGQMADLARLAAAAEADAGPRVLLVDDNDVARRVVTHILQRAGYKIDCASGGEEGIQAAGVHRYDLILMDLQMPNVNGLEATAAIRELPGYDGTPILALSANYSEEFTRACKEAGLQDFLSKPIQRDKLLRAIAQHLQ
jgi:CheY-like chemotaxis protein